VNHLPKRTITLGLPGESIDTENLTEVVRRFQNLHDLQLQHIQTYLTPSQSDFLDLLPLLFHCNHPQLPGFISSETPFGIPGYHPSSRTLECARQLSKDLITYQFIVNFCP
jgi:adenylate cyclase class 1